MSIPIKFYHNTQVQIRFNDIDIAGHVNNAIHLHYFDYGRIQYFNKVFKQIINWREEGFVIVNINIDYFKPICLDEEIIVETKINKIGKKSIEMIQQICLKNNIEEIKSTNKTILVGYNYKKNYSFEIPDKWKKCIMDFEKA